MTKTSWALSLSNQFDFSTCKGRKVKGQISGSDITFDGGVMLLSQIDKKINLKYPAEACF